METLRALITTFEISVAIYTATILAFLNVFFLSLWFILKEWRLIKNDKHPLSHSYHKLELFGIGVTPFFFIVSLFFIAYTSKELWGLFTKTPSVIRTYPSSHAELPSPFTPIVIETNVPVVANDIVINTNPSISLKVESKDSFGALPISRKFTVTPLSNFPPNSPIMLYASNIKNPITNIGSEFLVEFISKLTNHINSFQPIDGATDVLPNEPITIFLSGESDETELWEARLDPSVDTTVTTEGNKLTITPMRPLTQNTKYNFFLYRTNLIIDKTSGKIINRTDREEILHTTFTTIKSPHIASINAVGEDFNPTEPIVIQFDTPMDTQSFESKISLSPVSALNLSWNDQYTTLTLEHGELSRNTPYTLTIDPGIRTKSGGELQTAITHAFQTVGQIKISFTSPTNEMTHVSTNATITITFNQKLELADIAKNISINPPIQTKSRLEGTTIYLEPEEAMNENTLYTVLLNRNIPSIYGLPNPEQYSFSFTTEAQEYSLPVPYYKQEENFTCNIASLRMILAYKDIYFTEAQLKSQLPQELPRPFGNPHLGYTPEYGTYWEPIQMLLNKYTASHLYKEATIDDIVSELLQGHPLIIWSQNGWSKPIDYSWTAKDGTSIYAINGMHSYVVRGFTGPQRKPTAILVNDPWRGIYTMETEKFLSLLHYFDIALALQ